MSEFKKETRYVVLKLSKMTDHQKSALGAVLADIRLDESAMPECVVVESDWPNYQETWDSIQAICEGRFKPSVKMDDPNGQAAPLREPAPVQSETATNALHQHQPAPTPKGWKTKVSEFLKRLVSNHPSR